MGEREKRRSNHGEVEKSDGAGLKVRDRSSNVCSAAGCDEAKARERASIWRHVKWTTNGLEWWLRTRGCSDRRVARVSEEGFDLQHVCNGELAANGRRYKLICNLKSRGGFSSSLFFYCSDCCGSPDKGTS